MLQVRNISKKYVTGDLTQTALDHVSLDLRDNEFVAILGPSGSGKTTLLNVIGGLDRYDSGDLIINGISTKEYNDKDWDAYRNHTIGFVFQNYNLIPHQSILQNVELALTIGNAPKEEKEARALAALERVGLAEQSHKRPNQLSGGQMQRVAIARALVNDPDIILADEPTGALDSKTSIQIMDLLRELASDRLVVMVTHNPELADEYATRILHLKDGKIVSDTQEAEKKGVTFQRKKPAHTKLGFLTALSLSVNNLLTKKGRTALTSFAGSVGIIGIALILALTNGVNAYIAKVESDMLGSYPVRLRQQTVDMEGVLNTASNNSSVASNLTGSVSGTVLGSSEEETERVAPEGKIASDNVVADSIQTSTALVKNNDLRSFKEYLTKNYGKLKDHVTSIEYTYEIEPQVFRNDPKTGLVKVNPSSLTVDNTAPETENMSIYNMVSSSVFNEVLSSSWQQLPASGKLQKQQYELLAGNWPKKENEVALVVRPNGTVSDYTLYMLGLMDITDMENLIADVQQGKEVESKSKVFDYKDVLGTSFTCFAPAQLYQKSDSVYVDRSDDESYMAGKLGDGDPVTITAVLQSSDTAEISSGVAYTAALTNHLLKQTGTTPVVQAQMADPETNVLTGKRFGESGLSGAGNYLSGLLTTGTSLVTEAPEVTYDMWHPDKPVEFSDTVQIIPGVDLPVPGPRNSARNSRQQNIALVPTEIWMDYVQAILEQSFMQFFRGAFSQQEIETMVKQYINSLSDKEKQELIQKYTSTISADDIQKFADQYAGNLDASQVQKLAEQYLGQMSTEQKTQLVHQFLDKMDQAEIQKLIQQYVNSMSAEDIQDLASAYLKSMSTADLTALVKQYVGSMSQDQISSLVSSYLKSMSNAELQTLVTQYLSQMDQREVQKYLKQYLLQNQDQLLAALKAGLSPEQLKALIAEFSSDTPSTYDEVMKTLGNISPDDPSMIAIYPSDFAGKEAVVDFIQTYNDSLGDDSQQVTYTDVIATVTKSLTDIIHTISYVLIAFVAISLIVSSIMIAIITWISVLERTKEIGILRALGSSKNDVSRIFNAETVIEGFISGLFGVVLTYLLCIPINLFAGKRFGIQHVAFLQPQYALLLVLISVLLTFLAGYIPARLAAKKDPVLALRSE
ncbi:MAG: ABC transporter ATP-binding protein/permease [Clostridia bacterium]|nr:ABC transporter ATP-binding protein/permease [Clostridia bacterium]